MHRLRPLVLIACASLLQACGAGISEVDRSSHLQRSAHSQQTAHLQHAVESPRADQTSAPLKFPSSESSAVREGPLEASSTSESSRTLPPTQARTNHGTDTEKADVGNRSSREVPPFEITDLTGEELTSDGLIGKQAFVVVFFATWCELCSRKMPLVRRALEKIPGAKLLLVAVDSPETSHHVPGFLREQRLGDEQVINGLEFPAFTRGYNPVSSIPLIAIVGQSGELVDYQIGLLDDDGLRLESALRTAVYSGDSPQL